MFCIGICQNKTKHGSRVFEKLAWFLITLYCGKSSNNWNILLKFLAQLVAVCLCYFSVWIFKIEPCFHFTFFWCTILILSLLFVCLNGCRGVKTRCGHTSAARLYDDIYLIIFLCLLNVQICRERSQQNNSKRRS